MHLVVFNTGFSLRRHGKLWGEPGQIKWGRRDRTRINFAGLIRDWESSGVACKGGGVIGCSLDNADWAQRCMFRDHRYSNRVTTQNLFIE